MNKHFLSLCALLVVTGVYLHFMTTVTAVPLAKGMSFFPVHIGSFTKVGSQEFSAQVVEVAGVDNYLMWQYQDKDGYVLGLYIGYYTNQTEGSLIHSPKHCMPGSGWEIFESPDTIVKTADGEEYTVNRLIMQNGIDKQLAHYWYQGRGRVVANEYVDRALMVFDSLVRKRSDGSLVRVTGPGADIDRDIEKQEEFMFALLPVLREFLPK